MSLRVEVVARIAGLDGMPYIEFSKTVITPFAPTDEENTVGDEIGAAGAELNKALQEAESSTMAQVTQMARFEPSGS